MRTVADAQRAIAGVRNQAYGPQADNLRRIEQYLAGFGGDTPLTARTRGEVERAVAECMAGRTGRPADLRPQFAGGQALAQRHDARFPGRKYAAETVEEHGQGGYKRGAPVPGPSGFRANPYDIRGTVHRPVPADRAPVPLAQRHDVRSTAGDRYVYSRPRPHDVGQGEIVMGQGFMGPLGPAQVPATTPQRERHRQTGKGAYSPLPPVRRGR